MPSILSLLGIPSYFDGRFVRFLVAARFLDLGWLLTVAFFDAVDFFGAVDFLDATAFFDGPDLFEAVGLFFAPAFGARFFEAVADLVAELAALLLCGVLRLALVPGRG